MLLIGQKVSEAGRVEAGTRGAVEKKGGIVVE